MSISGEFEEKNQTPAKKFTKLFRMPRLRQILLVMTTLILMAHSFGADDENSTIQRPAMTTEENENSVNITTTTTENSVNTTTTENGNSINTTTELVKNTTTTESIKNLTTNTTTTTESILVINTTSSRTIETDEFTEMQEILTTEITTSTISTPTSTILNTQNSTTTVEPQQSWKTKNDSFNVAWECPNITGVGIECSCDFPHTLRCTGDTTGLKTINSRLTHNNLGISLLDLTVTGLSILPANFLEDISLHGLVVSTGELRKVHENAFTSLKRPLQALGLPNNLLESVPTAALSRLIGLDRLDLSRNKLKTLESDAFLGLTNLTYLDLCDNILSQLSPGAFLKLPSLRNLKMRSNHLSVSALSALRGLKKLEELDLSRNILVGNVSGNLLPLMPRLKNLMLSENELTKVQLGTLSGLRNLMYLSLSHNQIDVLEDHAFMYLSSLTRLDLSNNLIIAVSNLSLAHLENLTMLDLTHNFLRSLTSDLILPLKNLQDLRLDDNDITLVASDVPTYKLKLKRLSLSDNPLNCDCTLLDFANWLTNSSLEEEDKFSAVCATPPALENGILVQVSPGSLLCGDPTPATRLPISNVQIILKEFHYDELNGINLLWNIDLGTSYYTCDTLMIYETIGVKEERIESSPLHCDSRLMRDRFTLPVAIPTSIHLQLKHKYRYCVAILIPSGYDDISLGLGCSDVIVLEETRSRRKDQHQLNLNEVSLATTSSLSKAAITAVHVNVSKEGFLQVDVSLSLPAEFQTGTKCELSVVVFATESASVHRKKMNCSLTFITLSGLLPGHYKVCASLDEIAGDTLAISNHDRYRCVQVQTFKQNSEIWFLIVVIVVSILLLIIILVSRSFMKKLRNPKIQTQCFMPTQEFEITQKAHYIKLLATTKV